MRNPLDRTDGRSHVEAEVRRPDDHGVRGEAKVGGDVWQHQRLVRHDRVGAKGDVARSGVVADPDMGLRPDRVAVDDVDQGDRHSHQADDQPGEAVESARRLTARIEQVRRMLEPFRFVEGNRVVDHRPDSSVAVDRGDCAGRDLTQS